MLVMISVWQLRSSILWPPKRLWVLVWCSFMHPSDTVLNHALTRIQEALISGLPLWKKNILLDLLSLFRETGKAQWRYCGIPLNHLHCPLLTGWHSEVFVTSVFHHRAAVSTCFRSCIPGTNRSEQRNQTQKTTRSQGLWPQKRSADLCWGLPLCTCWDHESSRGKLLGALLCHVCKGLINQMSPSRMELLTMYRA